MLPAVITALLLIVMLLIIASFAFGVWRERQRHKQKLAALSTIPPHPLDQHVTAILHLQEGTVVSVEAPQRVPSFTLSSSWYIRRRTLVSVGFLVMVLLALFLQEGLAGGPLVELTKGLGFSFLSNSKPVAVQPSSQSALINVSSRVIRIDSADRKQYYTDYQWQVWSYSSCSGIAMEMVMNSYGRHLIAADVLQKELDLGVWSVQLGLLREDGVAMTAATYGFNTDAGHTRTLQDVVVAANKGEPVIVSIRDSFNFPGGHIFVITGGDGQNVFIADSSLKNFKSMSYPMFARIWQGFSAVLTPR